MSQPARLQSVEVNNPAMVAAAMQVMDRAFDPTFGEAWNASQLAGMMELPGSWLTIAWIDERPVGFALWRSVIDEAELLLLAVDTDYRRRAIGSQLLAAGLNRARHGAIRSIFLEVRSGNSALNLYQNFGFTLIKTRRGYYRGADGILFDSLNLCKIIDPAE